MPMNGLSSGQVKYEKGLKAHNPLSLFHKYKKKYLMYRRFVKTLVFENGALCDEVAHTQAKILRSKEERRFLLKKLLNFEERRESQAPKISSPLAATGTFQDLLAAPSLLSAVIKTDQTPKPKKKSSSLSTKKKKEDGSSADPSKPKRKRPTVRIKKIAQPIPVDNTSRQVFPLLLGELTIHSIGEIITDRPNFHDTHNIYPVGYCSTRMYASIGEKDSKCLYTCKISDSESGPKFEIAADNCREHCFIGTTASECHIALLNKLNEARGMKVVEPLGKGPEFFGISHPMVQNLIQSCQGARKCSRYQWIKFEVVRPDQNLQVVNEQERDASLNYDAFSQKLAIPKIKEEPMDT